VKRLLPLAIALLLAGCGVRPTGVSDGGTAPTGVAPGVTLYFLDAHDRLTPDLRRTGHLGTLPEALALLLAGPGGSDLRTGIAPTQDTRVLVTAVPGTIVLITPLTVGDVTPHGIDQIVCTALAVHVQGGGPASTRVEVRFTLATPASDERRTCPLLSPAR
jgi:hypothetical protein